MGPRERHVPHPTRKLPLSQGHSNTNSTQSTEIYFFCIRSLGITAPLIIRLRCIMQLAWNTGQQWDKPIPEDRLAEFQHWTEEIDHPEIIQLPRQLHNYRSQPKHHELHVFFDASRKAFAAVAYLRTTHDDNHVSITFLIGKARVTPMKRLTITNLELQAATLGSRLATYIKEELNLHIARTFMWTDSTTILDWRLNQRF